MTIRWNLHATLRKQGIENAHQLAERAGIGYPAAVRIFAHLDGDDPLGRFDLRTLEKLAVALNVKRPFSLLSYEPD
jgi:DNA-binding Xre family transcriptional regulator